VLVQYASWHWIFLINVPSPDRLLRACDLPDLRSPVRSRFDGLGYAMLAFGMVAISLALDGVSELGLRQVSVLVLTVFGFASLNGVLLHAVARAIAFPPALFEVPTLNVGLPRNLFSRSGAVHAFSCRYAASVDGVLAASGGNDDVAHALAGQSMKRFATPLSCAGLPARSGGQHGLVGWRWPVSAWRARPQPVTVHVLQLMCFGAVNSPSVHSHEHDHPPAPESGWRVAATAFLDGADAAMSLVLLQRVRFCRYAAYRAAPLDTCIRFQALRDDGLVPSPRPIFWLCGGGAGSQPSPGSLRSGDEGGVRYLFELRKPFDKFRSATLRCSGGQCRIKRGSMRH